MCSGTEDGRRKGKTPKAAGPVDCVLGHKVKSFMTVIERAMECYLENVSDYDLRILWGRPFVCPIF